MEYFFHAVGTEGKLMHLYRHSHFQPHGNSAITSTAVLSAVSQLGAGSQILYFVSSQGR